jgi:hypothetical protein
MRQPNAGFPEGLRVGQQPNEHAANHGPSVHSGIPAAIRPVEVGERNMVRGLADKLVQGINEMLEGRTVRRERGCSDQPVGLGKHLARIKGQAELLESRRVEG